MRKKRKCENCGGAYVFTIQNSYFERENRYLLSCPYCKHPHYLVIEDGRLIENDKASKYLKKLPAVRIPTQSWLELIPKD